MKNWVRTAKEAAGVGLVLTLFAVAYGFAWVAEGYNDGRFMPDYETPTKREVGFIVAFCIVTLCTINWWLPHVIDILF